MEERKRGEWEKEGEDRVEAEAKGRVKGKENEANSATSVETGWKSRNTPPDVVRQLESYNENPLINLASAARGKRRGCERCEERKRARVRTGLPEHACHGSY